jgi:triosephosphate isomerase
MDNTPRPLIAGNWKMHGSNAFAAELAGSLSDMISHAGDNGFDMLLCPPAPLLGSTLAAIGAAAISLGGQDCHAAEQGAYTGNISAGMLADAGCSYVIVGHSERRADHGETDDVVMAKAVAAQTAGLAPVVCVGETLEQRDAGKAIEVVTSQVGQSVPERSSAETVVIAYEPVWAIGTGRTPTLADIGKVHGAIRSAIDGVIGNSGQVRIIYGGSVKAENAEEILALKNVNGALVGGASLKAEDFWAIARAC